MTTNLCPICHEPSKGMPSENLDYFNCDVCRGIYVDHRLVRAPSTLDDWYGPLGAACELHDKYQGEPTIRFDSSVSVFDEHQNEIIATKVDFPETISTRANKLLSALVRRSSYFGQLIRITQVDYPLAYVKSYDELLPYIHFLEERGLILTKGIDSHGVDLVVSAAGHTAVENASLLPSLTVFLSSTCFDLRDCRCELALHLESLNCIVRVSDDPLRFDVSPTNDSIQSCLMNVRNSDVVFCLIDQRYGPPLPDGQYKGKSATHAEVEFARSNNIPVCFFIRRDAVSELSILKKDPSAKTSWVEPTNEKRRGLWVKFASEYTKLPKEDGVSNWFDAFNSIVDLKQIVSSRVHHIQSHR